MTPAIQKYLARYTERLQWPLVHGAIENVRMVVVIPALAECERLPATLASLTGGSARALAQSLVICVVNNRPEPFATRAEIENNQATLAILRAMPEQNGLRMAYVDASSPGRELPEREGVGLARKIGLDWGLDLLAAQGALPGVLACVDADSPVAPNYLDAVYDHFASNSQAWGGVVAYEHRLDGSPRENEGILEYELYLRYYSAGLAWAGSPFAPHSIGSTQACRAEAYAAVSGMVRRLAGEDFYFLEKLIKTGRVDTIRTTTVYPSGRASARVPFGTGRRILSFLEDDPACGLAYNPISFEILRAWLRVVEAGLAHGDAEDVLTQAGAIHPELQTFLDAACFVRTWRRMRQNSPNADGMRRQFHGWFDGLKTLRLIHALREKAFPDIPLLDAWTGLLARMNHPYPSDLFSPTPDRPSHLASVLTWVRNTHAVS